MSVRLAIILHFHEPPLVDPAAGRAHLPWVRLRALKDYYGTAALLGLFDGVRITVSLSPSLVQQLERLPEDDYASLALKNPRELTPEEVSFILERFFHDGLTGRLERYAELRRKKESAERFGHQDLRDLQVLSTLAWVHPLAFDSSEELASLRRKGSSFDEDDKRTLFNACSRLVRNVLPALLELDRAGRVELATSAYYHPVLPLLCSPPIPGAPDAVDDAREQLARGRAFHERVFGGLPGGLWPPELAMSEPAFSLIADAGCAWTIADEGSLVGLPCEEVYRVHERDGTAVVFRDRRLSELMASGRRRAGAGAGAAAAAELVSRMLRIGEAVDDAVVTLALDGGRMRGGESLRSLFEHLAKEPRVRTCTVAEAASEGRRALGALKESSWAPAGDFSPWSAQEAWEELFSARRVALGNGSESARDAVLAAEASDWFAAVGDEESPFREEYVALFRAHLERASAHAGPSRVAATGGGLLAAMSYHLDGGFLTVELEPVEGRGAELAQRRIELRFVEPIEARIAVAGLGGEGGRLFACDIEGRPHGRPFGKARLGKLLTLEVPLEALGVSPGNEAAFYLAVVEEEAVAERLPSRGPAWASPGKG